MMTRRGYDTSDGVTPGQRGRFLVGLDLGQANDPTALCVLKKTPAPPGHGRGPAFRLDAVHLARFPLGTPYPAIVRSVAELLQKPELHWDLDVVRYRPDDGRYAGPKLVIDATGVGRPVVDLFLEADLSKAEVAAVTSTGGHQATSGPWGGGRAARHHKVPKLQLVGAVQAGLQTDALKFVAGLAEAETLKRELLAFKVKVGATGSETFEAWRERDHDDLVLAVAIATWAAAVEPGVLRRVPNPFRDDRWD